MKIGNVTIHYCGFDSECRRDLKSIGWPYPLHVTNVQDKKIIWGWRHNMWGWWREDKILAQMKAGGGRTVRRKPKLDAR